MTFATLHVNTHKSQCGRCNGTGFTADIQQFGCCLECAEEILGERPMVLRELCEPAGYEPDDDMLFEYHRALARDEGQCYEYPNPTRGKNDE